MIVYKILDYVFATWSNIAVLRVINKVKIGLSGREIAKQAEMSAPSCFEALSALENLNIVTRQRGGREHFFFLNREHYVVKKIVIPILNSERKFAESIYSEIKEVLEKHSSSLIIFGSTARKEEKIESDLDLCVVFNNPNSKNKIASLITDLSLSLFRKYGVSLSPFYISEKEFFRRAKIKKSPVNDILKDGFVISGKAIESLLSEQENSKNKSR
ncbi:MAG: nucleotidyltransferase domain-containing protein [Ignavibacteriaceae bacterium]|nr:nucleotidyltransferase domain-containing protein [Ignavibacteriaceae bacterium]